MADFFAAGAGPIPDSNAFSFEISKFHLPLQSITQPLGPIRLRWLIHVIHVKIFFVTFHEQRNCPG